MSDDQDKQLKNDIRAQGQLITERRKEQDMYGRFTEMGLCSRCENLLAVKTKYGSTYAACEYYKMKLNHADPIVACTKHWEQSLYSLDDFLRMATMIDTKRKIGFGGENEYE